MVQFVPPTPKEEAPNYLGYSKGYSSGEVMAGAETSLGKLFGNIGGVVDAGAKGIKQAFDESIKSDAYALIDPIRAAHGGDLAPGEAVPIAGTGARGARYEAAGGQPIDDLSMGEARPLPNEAQAELGGLRKMKAAYEGGGLSNSHYSASLLAAAKELRAKYPGFREEVDSAFKGITGQDPANSLRSSILSDMNSMAAASGSQANKMMTQYRADAEYWGAVKPNLSFEEYTSNWQQWQTTVADLKAGKFTHEWKMREYEMESKGTANKVLKANDAATNFASNLAATKFRVALSQLDTKFQSLAGQGAAANATELQQLTTQATALKAQIASEFTAYVNKNIPDLTPEQRKGIVDNVINLPIDTIQQALHAKDTGIAHAAANISAQQGSQATLTIQRQLPSVLAIQGARTAIGDIAAGTLFNTTREETVPGILKLIKQGAFGIIANTETLTAPPKVSDVIKLQQDHGHGSGAATKSTLTGVQQLATSADPERAFRAVQSLYDDPGLWKNLNKNEAGQLYALLGSRDFTQKMIALGDKKPEAWEMYSKWMRANFQVVAAESLGSFNEAVSFNRYNTVFDPKEMQFTVTPKPGFEAKNTQGDRIPDNTQAFASRLNANLRLLNPVLRKQFGDNAPQELLQMLSQAGISFNGQKKGTWLEELGTAVKKAIPEAFDTWYNTGPAGTEGTKNAPVGKQSDADSAIPPNARPTIGSTDVKHITNAARPDDFWGNPAAPDFKEKHLTQVIAGKQAALVNKEAAAAFQGFLNELESSGYKINQLGGYALREQKNASGRISQHAFGNAIDINPGKNPFLAQASVAKTDLPEGIGEMANRWGLSWGGDWRGSKDAMHFEYTGKPVQKTAFLIEKEEPSKKLTIRVGPNPEDVIDFEYSDFLGGRDEIQRRLMDLSRPPVLGSPELTPEEANTVPGRRII